VLRWLKKSKAKADSQARRAVTDIPLEELRKREQDARQKLSDHSREINHMVEREARLMQHGKEALDLTQKKALAYEIQDIRKAKTRLERRFAFLARNLEVASQLIAIREDEDFYRENGLMDLLGNTDIHDMERMLEGYVDGAALSTEEQHDGIDRILKRVREYDLTIEALPLGEGNLTSILDEMDGKEPAKQATATSEASEQATPQRVSEIDAITQELTGSESPSADAPSIGEDTATFERRLHEMEE